LRRAARPYCDTNWLFLDLPFSHAVLNEAMVSYPPGDFKCVLIVVERIIQRPNAPLFKGFSLETVARFLLSGVDSDTQLVHMNGDRERAAA
jgi:hypothetical protein